jgi:6-pyruvoyltetrahydropterin/6-carboxytetrahydropterin synthase
MSFTVEVEHRFRAEQGLPSPVRARSGRPRLKPGAGVDLTVTVGVAFDDDQLTDRGWFFDTDAAAEQLDRTCAELATRAWTDLFDFRPTFELVARHLFGRLAPQLPQLAFVELYDESFGSRTRYRPAGHYRGPVGEAVQDAR